LLGTGLTGAAVLAALSGWSAAAKNAIYSKTKQFRAMVYIDDL